MIVTFVREEQWRYFHHWFIVGNVQCENTVFVVNDSVELLSWVEISFVNLSLFMLNDEWSQEQGKSVGSCVRKENVGFGVKQPSPKGSCEFLINCCPLIRKRRKLPRQSTLGRLDQRLFWSTNKQNHVFFRPVSGYSKRLLHRTCPLSPKGNYSYACSFLTNSWPECIQLPAPNKSGKFDMSMNWMLPCLTKVYFPDFM